MNDIVPRGFDARIEGIQEMHQQPIEEKDAAIALLNDKVKNREYENVGLQGEIRAKPSQPRETEASHILISSIVGLISKTAHQIDGKNGCSQ